MKVGVGGSWRAASLFAGVGGSWRPAALSVGVAGSWRNTEGSGGGGGGGSTLAIVASPTVVTKTRFGPGSVTTDPITFTASGGTPPYTYLGVRHDGSTSISAVAPAGASSAFTGYVALNDTLMANFTWTVTDSLGATASCTGRANLIEIS